MRRLLCGSLAASAAIAALVLGSATAASAAHTVEVEDTGTLLAKGAGVIVPVTVTCAPSTSPFPFPGAGTVTVTLTQRAGNRVAQASGTATAVCTGAPQTVDVLLTAGDVAFKHGTALVTASMLDCQDFMTCHFVTDTEEITLRK